ncbi:SpvB/TcaC N-terminal domain-containing protein [Fodinibius sp.]|uniref:SpvB/TcaC N-terminal domain-containing protein n=1 Tax=Fodinibius sp. TaxID=1872440 RepID=UPI003567917B
MQEYSRGTESSSENEILGMNEQVDVNKNTGSVVFQVPIPLPEDRSDFSPRMNLMFQGHSNGPFGMGWNLSLDSISRSSHKSRPTYEDFDEKDSFQLSGVGELVSALKEAGSKWSQQVRKQNGFEIYRYRTRSDDSGMRVERWVNTRNGRMHWRTFNGNGVTSIFGVTEQGRIADPSDNTKVYRWLLEKRYDDRGNIQVYEYKKENLKGVKTNHASESHRLQSNLITNRYLKRIKYGNTEPFDPDSQTMPEDNRWLFEVVLDYGEHREKEPEPQGTQDWSMRPDPFSNYQSGFEVRTYRLCRRVLLFHHFKELGPDSVHTGSFKIEYGSVAGERDPEGRAGMTITNLSRIGFKENTSGERWSQKIPPLEIRYTEAEVEEEIHRLEDTHLPTGIDGIYYQPFDLYGEGLNGILAERNGAWYYQENKGDGSFSHPRATDNRPASKPGTYQLSDVDGNGHPDLIHLNGEEAGYYEVEPDTRSWQPFDTFEQAAQVGMGGPHVQSTDLTGNGRADLAISEPGQITWYGSEGKKGFDKPRQNALSYNQDESPPQVNTDPSQGYYVANISGNGQDVVRVRNNEVCYWPNLGYGNYGKKVVMDHAPFFDRPESYDPQRLHLVDLTGTGTSDLLYINSEGARYWINESGNGFSNAHEISSFPAVSNLQTVFVMDLLGEGTPCLVWSSSLPSDSNAPLRYIRLTGDTTPNLLATINNNMGREVNFSYASSADFYLADMKAGRSWHTKLHSHVPVVERVEYIDHISNTRSHSRYIYHDGYFDGEEREFRGFSFVEQYDTENFSKECYPELESDDYVQPTCTKTWFHNGASGKDRPRADLRRQDYYKEDDKSKCMFRPVIEEGDLYDTKTISEAHKVLSGKALREEVYAVEKGEISDHPYSVDETNYRVRIKQPAQEDSHGSYQAYQSQELTYQYEQEPEDPRITHQFVLRVDDLGYPVRTSEIAYPRREGPNVTSEQSKLYATVQEQELKHIDNGVYRHGIPVESRMFEVGGLQTDSDDYFSWKSLNRQVDKALQSLKPFDSNLDSPTDPAARLIGWDKQFYYSSEDEFTRDPLKISLPLRLHHTEEAAFNDSLLGEVFGSRLDATSIKALNYTSHDGYWWQPSDVRKYLGAEGFYQPKKNIDQFGNSEILAYNDDYLTIESRTDKAGNVTKYFMDFHAVRPKRIVDPNENVREIRFDPLGRAFATSMYGKAVDHNGQYVRQGDRPLNEYTVQPEAENIDSVTDPKGEILNAPQRFLQGATTFYYYDLFAWKRSGTPPSTLNLKRETHVSNVEEGETSRLQTQVHYVDGFGRPVQTKKKVEPGSAYVPAEDGTVSEMDDVQNRWVATGGVVYNNKGLAVKKYEPIFTGSPRFESGSTFLRHGVTSKQHYDPLGRKIKTDTPKGFFTETIYTPWEIREYDENDTVERSFYYESQVETGIVDGAEKDAIEKAQEHFDTPDVKVFDPLGRRILQKQIVGLSETLETRNKFDIQGNLLSSIDPRQQSLNEQRSADEQVTTLETVYDMMGNSLLNRSIDSGTRRQFTDVLDRPVHQWSARDFHTITSFDSLSRPVEVRVIDENNSGGLDHVVKKNRFGEDFNDTDEAKRRNLLTRLAEQRDQAGLVEIEGCDIGGRPLETSRQIRSDYKTEADWSSNVLLDDEVFTTTFKYNALGRVKEKRQADGSIHRPSYHISGLMKRIHVRTEGGDIDAPIVQEIEYNARGQRTHVGYDNDVHTNYIYDKDTFRLKRMVSKHKDNNTVRTRQDIDYTYDPVGNLTRKDDQTRSHIFGSMPSNHDQQRRYCDYTYDPLYRLKEATGWMSKSLQQHDYGKNGKPPEAFKGTRHLSLNNGQALTPYTRKYKYDKAGNMSQMKQVGDVSWTRDMWISERSNRSITEETQGGTIRSNPEELFDEAGNLTDLDHLDGPLKWNYRDQLAKATIIERSGESSIDDAEYYVYGSGGQRVRKVKETLEDGNVVVREKIYLGGCEIKRERRGDRVTLDRKTTHVKDDRGRIALIHQWTKDENALETDNVGTPAIHYQLEDRLGSSSLELDEDGDIISYEEFYPFGRSALIAGDKIKEVIRKEYRYSGKEYDDATGLYYYGLRYLATWLGRWLNPDPMGPVDGLNLYQFARNNPIGLRDTTGAQSQDAEELRRAEEYLENRALSPSEVDWPEDLTEEEKEGYQENLNQRLEEEAEAGRKYYAFPTDPREDVEGEIFTSDPGDIISLKETVEENDDLTLVRVPSELDPEEQSDSASGSFVEEDQESEESTDTSQSSESDVETGGDQETTDSGNSENSDTSSGSGRRENNTERQEAENSAEGSGDTQNTQGNESPEAQPDSRRQPFGDPKGKVCEEIKETALGEWAESVQSDQELLAREAQNHGYGFAIGTGVLNGLGSIGVGTVELLDTGSDVIGLGLSAAGEAAGIVPEGKTMEFGCRLSSRIHSAARTVGTIANDPIGTISRLHEAAVNTLADAMMGDKEALSNTVSTITEIGVGLIGPGKGRGAFRGASKSTRAADTGLDAANTGRRAQRSADDVTQNSSADMPGNNSSPTIERLPEGRYRYSDDPPNTYRDRNGSLHDEETGNFVTDPKSGNNSDIQYRRGLNQAKFRRDAARKIRSDEDHPLRFLLDEDGTLRSGRGREELPSVEAGHMRSKYVLDESDPDRLVLEDADFNSWTGRSVESRRGWVDDAEGVLIGGNSGVPVDLETARMWEELGLLTEGTVAGAPPIRGWIYEVN